MYPCPLPLYQPFHVSLPSSPVSPRQVLNDGDRDERDARLAREEERRQHAAGNTEGAAAAAASPRRGLQRKMTARLQKAGFLVKLAMKSKSNWRKRWFIIDSHGVLRYYKGSKASKHKGQMHLMEASNVEVVHTGYKKKFVFKVTTPNHAGAEGDVHELVCSASSEQVRRGAGGGGWQCIEREETGEREKGGGRDDLCICLL
jgi:hypothetical protein